jgi:dinuclear metal center YbgI/SA1388 family protein
MCRENQMSEGVRRDELARYLDDLLAVPRFRDYCPNGLQVEGSPTISRIVAGVSACQALLDEAIRLKADAVLVHHGYFWKGEDSRLIGARRSRIKTLLTHNINLFGYHLPLDAHPELGNNAQLAKLFGWQPTARFGDQDIAWVGEAETTFSVEALNHQCQSLLKRSPLVIGDGSKFIRRIAWCSGGGDGYFEGAIAQGVDAFFSGEVSEPAVHLARETGVAYFAAGHHATERYGVKALAEHLALTFKLDCTFVDIDNPA